MLAHSLLLLVAMATLCVGAVTAVATPTPIVAVTAMSLQTENQFELSHLTLNAAMTKVHNLTTIGGVLPASSAYDPVNNWLITNSLCPRLGGSCLTYVDADSGDVAHVVASGRGLVFSNVEHDSSLKTTFVTGFDEKARVNHVFAVNPLASIKSDQQLKSILALPQGDIININISTMDSERHILYFTLQVRQPSFGNAVMGVDVTTGKVVSHAVVPKAAITSLLWHGSDGADGADADATLWAFTAQGQNALNLVTLDVVTGNVTATHYSNKSFSNNGMPVLFDSTSKIIYVVVIATSQPPTPTWMVLDFAHRTGTSQKLTYYPIDMHWRTPSSHATETSSPSSSLPSDQAMSRKSGEVEHFTF